MPADQDKYPSETGRRRFVKGVVGSATLAGVGTGTAVTVNSATQQSGAGGGPNQYIGIENTGGPAPRGMPMIPLTIEDGALKGVWPEVEMESSGGRKIAVAETDIGGFTYSSEWFQYCGVQTYEGIQPKADQDNFFRVSGGSPYDWQADQETGAKITVDMFDDYEEWGNGIGKAGLGKPATGSWRSQGDVKTIPVQVLRSPEVSKIANGEGKYSDLPGTVRDFFSAATERDFMAWLNKCTHFCCVPGFKTSTYASAEDQVYCQCHQSRYDPFTPKLLQFIALPRPG